MSEPIGGIEKAKVYLFQLNINEYLVKLRARKIEKLDELAINLEKKLEVLLNSGKDHTDFAQFKKDCNAYIDQVFLTLPETEAKKRTIIPGWMFSPSSTESLLYDIRDYINTINPDNFKSKKEPERLKM